MPTRTFDMRIPAGTTALVLLLVSMTAGAGGRSFGTVVDNLDRRKVTKLHAQDYCKSIRGDEVSWSGEVYDVKGGRTGAKIFVAESSRPIYRGYNIVVVTPDVSRAADIRKGQRIRFKGRIDGCNLKDNGAIIEVEDATVLK